MKFWVYLFAGVLSILLFVGGPDYESHRIIKHVWDFGHVVLFAALSYIMLDLVRDISLSSIYKFLIIIILSFIVGLSIEVVQLVVGRNFEIRDLVSDISGAVIGYIVFYMLHKKHSLSSEILLSLPIFLLLIINIFPLFNAIIDEIEMRNKFPVLSNFESYRELSRWDVNQVNLSLSKDYKVEGENSLQAIFLPDEFPDITLQHFLRNWTGFKLLNVSVFNPDSNDIEIEFKIYDRQHIDNGYKYNDRFNKIINLKSGWNHLKIKLTRVINAPKNRRMDIDNIKSMSFFMVDLARPKILYFDAVFLTN